MEIKVSDILYKKLKIKTNESHPSIEEMLAVITHWMHNANQASASPYGAKCRKYLQTILCALSPEFDKKHITLKSIKELGLFKDVIDVPFPTPKRTKFTFIDLFAGGKKLDLQLFRGKILDQLALPGVFRMENLIRLAVVNFFVV